MRVRVRVALGCISDVFLSSLCVKVAHLLRRRLFPLSSLAPQGPESRADFSPACALSSHTKQRTGWQHVCRRGATALSSPEKSSVLDASFFSSERLKIWEKSPKGLSPRKALPCFPDRWQASCSTYSHHRFWASHIG